MTQKEIWDALLRIFKECSIPTTSFVALKLNQLLRATSGWGPINLCIAFIEHELGPQAYGLSPAQFEGLKRGVEAMNGSPPDWM